MLQKLYILYASGLITIRQLINIHTFRIGTKRQI